MEPTTTTATSLIPSIVTILVAVGSGWVGALLALGVYKNKIDNLETTLGKDEHSGLRKTVSDIRDKVVSCEATIKANGPLTERKSPVSLSDRGEELLNNSEAKQFVNNNLEELSKKVEELRPKTAYDVQENSWKVLQDMSDDDRFNTLKEYLFQEGLKLEDLVTVMGIYLRDNILKNKGWNTEDIDKHDPNYLVQ